MTGTLEHIKLAAMEIAADSSGRVVERGQLDLLAVELEDALRDTVAVTSDDAAPVGIAVIPPRR